ncbi:MAG: hypothetical protein ACKPB0_07870, partial [Opitutaceae bacterium]
PGLRRRWFESADLDLVVWYAADGAIAGFQLLYGTPRGERALTWNPGPGFSHHAIDAGDRLLGKLSPVLVPCAESPAPDLATRFAAQAGSLETALADFVVTRLRAATSSSEPDNRSKPR